MIFLSLKHDSLVQVDDKIRLDALSVFSPDGEEITLLEIQPDGAELFYDVTSSKYLDWQYSTNGEKTIVLRVNTTEIKTFTLEVLNESEDNLFSTDDDLTQHESDILNWLPRGRNSYIFKHRMSQTIILEWIDRNGLTKANGDRYTKADITDVEEVKHWSKYQTLALIFEGLSNAIDDIYADKANRYRKLRNESRNRAILRLDTNGDGTTDALEGFNMTVLPLSRR